MLYLDLLRTVRASPATALGLGAVGVAMAALGQALTTRTVPAKLSWLAFFDDRLQGIYKGGAAQSVAAAMVLLAVGAILFAVASRRSAGEEEKPAFGPLTRVLSLRTRADFVAVAAFAVGAALFATIILRLYNGHYSHGLALLLLPSLVLLAAPFLRRDLQVGVGFRPRLSPSLIAEMAFLAAVIAGFMFLNLRDLTNWRFSAIGDEYINYFQVKALAGGETFNAFSLDGDRAILGTAIQAMFFKLFGGGIFAWKLHLVVFAAASFVPFYLLVRELFSQRAAMFSTVLFASSHYLFAYVHHPKYIDELLPTVLALWLLAVGLRRNSTLALFGSGMAAGFGFYVFPSARLAIVIMAIYLLTFGLKSIRPATVLPIALSFAAVVGPMFAVERWDVVNVGSGGTLFSYPYPNELVRQGWDLFGYNVVRSIMAFNYNPDGFHYVWGSLLDPVSAVLYVLGIGLALSRFRHPAFRLLIVWWAVALVGSGFTNPYERTAITRLHYVLPAVAALGGVALDQALHLLHNVRPNVSIPGWPNVSSRTALVVAALGVLIPLVLFLNLHRFWYETPRNHQGSFGTVVVRGVLTPPCRDRLPEVSIFAQSAGSLLAKVFDAYQLGERSPALFPVEDGVALSALDGSRLDSEQLLPRPPIVPYDKALAVFKHNAVVSGDIPDGCIVIMGDATADSHPLYQSLLRFQSRYPEKQTTILTDLSGRSKVTMLY